VLESNTRRVKLHRNRNPNVLAPLRHRVDATDFFRIIYRSHEAVRSEVEMMAPRQGFREAEGQPHSKGDSGGDVSQVLLRGQSPGPW
jgi:hypothetical protein